MIQLKPWQKQAIKEGGYTVKYTLVTDKFMHGISALQKASTTMNDVFQDYVPADPDSKDGRNEAYSTALAILALLDTISMLPEDDEAVPLSKCRVLDVYYGKANYINEDGVCVNWEHHNGNWVFWVLLPSDNFKEPGGRVPLSELLAEEGFAREAL